MVQLGFALLVCIVQLNSLVAQTVDTVRVACVGNSITWASGSGGYPAELQGLLDTGKVESCYQVKNFGAPGACIIDQGSRPYADESVFNQVISFKPHQVIILLGTNDSQPQNWEHKETLGEGLSSLIDTFATIAEHRQTWVCLPLPAFSTKFEINDSIIQNGIIPIIDSVAQARGLPLIDCYTPFLDHQDYYNSDGIHLNADGLAFLATIIYNRMSGQTAITYHKPLFVNVDTMLRIPGPGDYYNVTGRSVVPGNTGNGVYLMCDRKNNVLKKVMVIKQ